VFHVFWVRHVEENLVVGARLPTPAPRFILFAAVGKRQ
jgi:hypothetical protein